MLRAFGGAVLALLLTIVFNLGTESLLVRFLARGGGGVSVLPETQAVALQLMIALLTGLLAALVAPALAKRMEFQAAATLAALRLLMLAASAPQVRGKQPDWYLVLLTMLAIGTAFLAGWIVWRWRRRGTATGTADAPPGAATRTA